MLRICEQKFAALNSLNQPINNNSPNQPNPLVLANVIYCAKVAYK